MPLFFVLYVCVCVHAQHTHCAKGRAWVMTLEGFTVVCPGGSQVADGTGCTKCGGVDEEPMEMEVRGRRIAI